MSFTYGQKSRWLAIDGAAYWGKGIACSLSQYEYEKVIQKVNFNHHDERHYSNKFCCTHKSFSMISIYIDVKVYPILKRL
jgi:hypothetical protein